MQMNELQKALDKTKIALMQKQDSAFFASIAFSLKFVWDDSCRTAYTDGQVIGWNPDWFMQLPPAQRVGVMIHEAMHVAYDHIGARRQGRDPEHWNDAADHVINLMLLERGFELPSFRLADTRFKGMDTETVYKLLQGQGKPQPNPMPDLREMPGKTQEEAKRVIEDIIIRASVQSRLAGDKAGTIPGEIQLYLDSLLQPKLPWTTLLRRYMTEFNKNDYTWKRPNRRFFPQHHLPSMWSQSIQNLTFFVDISGSVSDHQFKQFVSDIAGVMKMMKPKEITIVQFDTRIQGIDKVHSIQELMKVSFTGRGGTQPECIFEYMDQHNPQVSLVFTDGCFQWSRERLRHDLMWLINDNPRFVPKFGRAIHFDTKDS